MVVVIVMPMAMPAMAPGERRLLMKEEELVEVAILASFPGVIFCLFVFLFLFPSTYVFSLLYMDTEERRIL
jgi:hypothetical protein